MIPQSTQSYLKQCELTVLIWVLSSSEKGLSPSHLYEDLWTGEHFVISISTYFYFYNVQFPMIVIHGISWLHMSNNVIMNSWLGLNVPISAAEF